MANIFDDNVARGINDALVASGLTKGKDITTIRFGGDLIQGNRFDMIINGVAIVPLLFNTSHLNTMKNIVTNIEAHADVSRATIHNDHTGNPREIHIIGAAGVTALTITAMAVTLGASQTTVEEDDSDLAGKGVRDIVALPVIVIQEADTMGQGDFEHLTGAGPHTPPAGTHYVAIKAWQADLELASLSTVDGVTTLAGDTVTQDDVIYGRFDSVGITSGEALAYKSRVKSNE